MAAPSHQTLLVFGLRVLPRGLMLLKKTRKPSDHARMERRQTLAAAQRSIHQVETVPRRRQQTEKTVSAENSCRDTPVASSSPDLHGISQQTTNKKPRRNTVRVSFQRLFDRNKCLSGGVFSMTAAKLRASHCSHYGLPINANQAADSVRPVIADLRTSTSAGN